MSFSVRLGAIFAGALLLTSCWEGTTRSVAATILATEGTVRVKESAGAELLAARPGLALGAGAVVRSAEGSQGDIALLPNTLVRMLGVGELIIDNLQLSKNGNETGDAMTAREVEISFPEGTLFVRHRRPAGSGGAFRVKTSRGTITATSDCLFCIEAGPERVRVVCVRGLVGLVPSEDEPGVSVKEGRIADSSAEKTTVVEVATDPAAQKNVTDALEIESQLLLRARSRRNVLPY